MEVSVYVDKLQPCMPWAKWRYPESCHMWADSLDELHAFAARLGLKRAWFQNNPKLPHYDLTAARRARAINLGAEQASLMDYIRRRDAPCPEAITGCNGQRRGLGGK